MARAKLTPLAKQAAMLAAMGKGPRESAKLLGCNEKTIVHYGREDWWLAERDKWIAAGLAKLDEAITAQRVSMLALHDEFIDGVRAALNAQLPSGDPNWPVRLQGLRLIHDHPAIKALLGPAPGSANDGQSAPGQVTVVQFNLPPGAVAPTEYDIIDQEPLELPPGDPE